MNNIQYAIVTRDRESYPDAIHFLTRGTVVRVTAARYDYAHVETIGQCVTTMDAVPTIGDGYTQEVEAQDLMYFDYATSAAIEAEVA